MLAYSSIAHGGYLLVASFARTTSAKAPILFYLLMYAVTNLGAFGVVASAGDGGTRRTTRSATTPGCGTSIPRSRG